MMVREFKYFMLCGHDGCNIMEFEKQKDMLEYYKQEVERYPPMKPIVYYGKKLEFEPAEIVKSWKVKET